MPTVYERDDDRRLITLTITEPYSVDDVVSAIERQMAEHTCEYAVLYDRRATAVGEQPALALLRRAVDVLTAATTGGR